MTMDLATYRQSYRDFVKLYKPEGTRLDRIDAYCKKFGLGEYDKEMLKLALEMGE